MIPKVFSSDLTPTHPGQVFTSVATTCIPYFICNALKEMLPYVTLTSLLQLIFPTISIPFIPTVAVPKAILFVREKGANVVPSLTSLMTTPAGEYATLDMKTCPPTTVSHLMRTGYI